MILKVKMIDKFPWPQYVHPSAYCYSSQIFTILICSLVNIQPTLEVFVANKVFTNKFVLHLMQGYNHTPLQ
eukprot:c20842_g2_i1 orf=294-506(+)